MLPIRPLHSNFQGGLEYRDQAGLATIARRSLFSYTTWMTTNLLAPGSADALLFDLGRVVIDIDFNRTLACWADHAGCDPADLVTRFARDDVYKGHERGEIDDAAFFASLRTSLGIHVPDSALLEGWNAIFVGEMEGIAPLLARAGQRVPLYAFSNTNRAHERHVRQHFADVLDHFREIFLSSTIGLRKPDANAYDHVVKVIGVPAPRIVFFDDLMENIEGARACGLTAVHVTSIRDVAEALKALDL
jgi:FMN phosphatase YigB (HAD superfamily)